MYGRKKVKFTYKQKEKLIILPLRKKTLLPSRYISFQTFSSQFCIFYFILFIIIAFPAFESWKHYKCV